MSSVATILEPSGCLWNPLERVPGVPSVSLTYFYNADIFVSTEILVQSGISLFSPWAQRVPVPEGSRHPLWSSEGAMEP